MNPAIPFLIGGIVAFVVILAINARKQNNCTFDERQLAGRGDAFKGGFFSLLIYVTTSELTTILMDKEWITPDCNLALALSISSMTFAIICIVNEAYIGLEQNTKSTIITSSIISVTNTIIGLLHMSDNKFVVVNEGRLDLDVNFTVGLALLIVTIVLILHTRISRKSEESYEES